MGYSLRLAAKVLLYASSHRQDITCHGLCYTSRGALIGTRIITNKMIMKLISHIAYFTQCLIAEIIGVGQQDSRWYITILRPVFIALWAPGKAVHWGSYENYSQELAWTPVFVGPPGKSPLDPCVKTALTIPCINSCKNYTRCCGGEKKKKKKKKKIYIYIYI